MREGVSATATLALAVTLAGCGGGGAPTTSPGMMNGGRGAMHGGPPASVPAVTTASTADEGRALFLASGCGGCHTLAAASTAGTTGPNLDRAHPGYELVVRLVTRGEGRMPAFADSLSASQITAIARFVADAAG